MDEKDMKFALALFDEFPVPSGKREDVVKFVNRLDDVKRKLVDLFKANLPKAAGHVLPAPEANEVAAEAEAKA